MEWKAQTRLGIFMFHRSLWTKHPFWYRWKKHILFDNMKNRVWVHWAMIWFSFSIFNQLKVAVLKKANIQATSEEPHRHFIEADGAKQILLVALFGLILNIGLSVLKAIGDHRIFYRQPCCRRQCYWLCHRFGCFFSGSMRYKIVYPQNQDFSLWIV